MSSFVLITGASRGFGRAIALRMAEFSINKRMHFVLVGRNESRLKETASDIFKLEMFRNEKIIENKTKNSNTNTSFKFTVSVLIHDAETESPLKFLTKLSEVYDTGGSGSTTEGERGSQTLTENIFLFNNVSSFGHIGPVETIVEGGSCLDSDHSVTQEELLSHYCQINIQFPMLLTSYIVRKYKDAGYKSNNRSLRIVNTSSLAAIEPFSTWSGYCTAKAAMDMFHKVVAIENTNDETVKCLNYAPGPMATELHSNMLAHEKLDENIRRVHSEMVNNGEMVDPMDSAAKCVKLLLEDSFISGAHLDYYDLP